MKTLLVVVALCLAAAVAWGLVANERPVPARAKDSVAPVDASWADALPADAARATQAYLDRIPADMRARGEDYAGTRFVVLSAHLVTLVAATILFLFTGAAARLRALTTRVGGPRLLQDALFALVYFTLLYALTLPVSTYAGFVRPRAFGFSAEGYGAWLADDITNFAVLTSFYVVGMVAIFALIRTHPRTWAAWGTGIYVALSSLYAFVAPLYIEPLFNRIEPMHDGPQKAAILSLLRANGVAHAEVYVRDASRQTRLLNAYVSGLGGTARVVVDDNTLVAATPDSTRFVLAHELGHYVLGHIGKSIVSGGLVMGAGFLLMAWCLGGLVRRFGTTWGTRSAGDIAALPALWFLFLLWGYLALPVTNAISRTHETEADLFGLNASQAPNGLAEFMIHDADTARLDPSPLEVALFYTHPGDRSRVEMAMRWRAEHLPARLP
jgi:STE24 endopeptidase